jgi:hypothetical protein
LDFTLTAAINSYKVGADRRVSAIGIFNSGEFTAPATSKTAAAVGKKPVFYFLGGPSDIAYKNVRRTLSTDPGFTDPRKGRARLRRHDRPEVDGPAHQFAQPAPAPRKAADENQGGHMATYKQPNSGLFGRGQSKFLTWMLRGNATSREYFTGGGARADGWLNITTSGLGAINIPAL